MASMREREQDAQEFYRRLREVNPWLPDPRHVMRDYSLNWQEGGIATMGLTVMVEVPAAIFAEGEAEAHGQT